MKIDTNTVACITGGADGIGLALAQEFLHRGAAVALVDIRESALQNAEQILGVSKRLSTHVLDVRNREAIPAVLDNILAAHGGRINVLINSAGVVGGSTLDRISYEDFDRVMNVNLQGTFNMCKEVFPHLRSEREAYICNLSSLDGLIAMPGAMAYVASKFAITGLTKAMSMDLALIAPNVRVCNVHPGFVSTNMVANNGAHVETNIMNYDGDWGKLVSVDAVHKFQLYASSTSPQQAAQQIVRGMYWNQTKIIVGNDAFVMDLLARAFPTLIQHKFVFMPVLVIVLLLVRLIGKWQLLAGALFYAAFKRR